MNMKQNLLCLLAAGAVALPPIARSQEQKQYTKQDYEQAVQAIQRTVDGQKDRVETVTGKLKATDEQIERRIARVVEHLSTVTDNRDSGTRIIRAKEDILDGLKKTIDFYVRERDTRFAELYRATTRIPKEDLLDDVNRLNNRIEKRVQQALALTMSLPEEKDVPQILQTYYGDAVTTQINPEYTHNKMLTSRAKQMRQKVNRGLEASIANLERSNNELERNLQYARTDRGREVLQDFMKRNREVADKRRADILRILTDSRPASKTLGSKAADELVRQVQAERLNAKNDSTEWIRLKNERDTERAKLYECEQRLAAYARAVEKM